MIGLRRRGRADAESTARAPTAALAAVVAVTVAAVLLLLLPDLPGVDETLVANLVALVTAGTAAVCAGWRAVRSSGRQAAAPAAGAVRRDLDEWGGAAGQLGDRAGRRRGGRRRPGLAHHGGVGGLPGARTSRSRCSPCSLAPADIAMYAAKRSGKARIRHATPADR